MEVAAEAHPQVEVAAAPALGTRPSPRRSPRRYRPRRGEEAGAAAGLRAAVAEAGHRAEAGLQQKAAAAGLQKAAAAEAASPPPLPPPPLSSSAAAPAPSISSGELAGIVDAGAGPSAALGHEKGHAGGGGGGGVGGACIRAAPPLAEAGRAVAGRRAVAGWGRVSRRRWRRQRRHKSLGALVAEEEAAAATALAVAAAAVLERRARRPRRSLALRLLGGCSQSRRELSDGRRWIKKGLLLAKSGVACGFSSRAMPAVRLGRPAAR